MLEFRGMGENTKRGKLVMKKTAYQKNGHKSNLPKV
jgi:hypothetical protein